MRLVEQPERRPPGDEGGERDPTPLPVEERPTRGLEDAAGDPEPFQCRVRTVVGDTGRPEQEPHVLDGGEIGVEGGGVAHEADVADGPAVDPQVVPEDVCLA